MRNYEKAYYKKNLDYLTYTQILRDVTHTNYDLNTKFIFDTDNDDFVWIFIWSQWIQKPKTCFTWQYGGGVYTKNDPVAFSSSVDQPEKNFNLNPYRGAGEHRCFPVVDISDFITILNEGVQNPDYEKLLQIPFSDYYKKLGKFDLYIDQPFDELKNSANGTFFDIINTIGYSPELFYSKNSFVRNVNSAGNQIKAITYKTITDEGFNVMNDLYQKVIQPITSDWTAENYKTRQIELSDLASRIYKIVISFTNMYADLYNTYQQTVTKEPQTPYQLDTTSFKINREDVGSLPIEEALLLAKPPLQPAFKKSYIVRENNLKAFVMIKMEYQVGQDSDNFITLNYFDIPYNNILSMEHNVKDFNMTINLIDTEGNLSELFIQKMYAMSQKKTNALVEKNMVKALGEYRFFIEYGWAGPDTDNSDELLEEQVYVKTIHRGYIKSISSQYTFKGTEYSLSIIPNDLSHFNSGFNDTNMLYFKKENGVSIPIGLLILSFVIDNFDKIVVAGRPDLKSKINDIYKNKETNFIFQLFEEIDKSNIIHKVFPVTATNPTASAIDYFIIADIQINVRSDQLKKEYKELMTLLATIRNTQDDQTTSNRLQNINFLSENFESILSILEKNMIGVNAWLTGMYVIWKIAKQTQNPNSSESFSFTDLTSMFPLYGQDGTTLFKVTDTDILNVIEIFNPCCVKKTEIPTAATSDDIYKYIINNNDFNKYYISQFFNLEPEKAPNAAGKEERKDLTFVTRQISGIFSQIKNIGMNITGGSSEHNIYQGADGIGLIYDIFKEEDLKDKQTKNKIIEDYKRKIYSEKDNIYSKVDDLKAPEKRYETEFEKFSGRIDKLVKLDKNSVHIYLSYITNPLKVAFLNCSLSKKISLLSKQLCQSYSFSPKMTPTRNANKQFFGQGNAQLLKEGSGDIIEFNIDPIDIGNFNSIMLANKNKNNVAFNNVSSHTFVSGLHQNAAQYYRTYRNIDGTENISKLTQDMARLDLNYQSQTAIKGSITIPGEPYWSNVNLLMAKCIYIHVYYASGARSSHSGLYYVANVVQNISEGKFTTKIDIIRAPTFLSPLEKIVNKNKFVS